MKMMICIHMRILKTSPMIIAMKIVSALNRIITIFMVICGRDMLIMIRSGRRLPGFFMGPGIGGILFMIHGTGIIIHILIAIHTGIIPANTGTRIIMILTMCTGMDIIMGFITADMTAISLEKRKSRPSSRVCHQGVVLREFPQGVIADRAV